MSSHYQYLNAFRTTGTPSDGLHPSIAPNLRPVIAFEILLTESRPIVNEYVSAMNIPPMEVA